MYGQTLNDFMERTKTERRLPKSILISLLGKCLRFAKLRGCDMVMLAITWDLPPAEQMQDYTERSRRWVSVIMSQQGVVQFRGYRNPYRTSPMAMINVEFDDLASCFSFINSDDYMMIYDEMRSLGATDCGVQVWTTSPATPQGAARC